MKYVKVKWVHDFVDTPVLLYSELNQDWWEIRKVEVYPDGRADFADSDEQSGSTQLSTEPFPTLEEIATDPQFQPITIAAEEFESVWAKAKTK